MGQGTRVRRQASIAIANATAFGQKFVQPLSRGMLLREIMLRLSGSLTYGAAANNASATLGRGDEWSIISRIELIANGTDIIRSMSGPQLRMLNRFLFGNIGRTSATLGDGTTAAPTYDSTLVLPLWMPLAIRPLDTVLDTSQLSDLRLEITVGAATGDINSANGPTNIAATVDISTYESFGVQGKFSGTRIYALQQASPGANPNYQIQLPVTPMYRGWIINAADGAGNTATDLANAITNVQLKSGTTVFRDIPFAMLRDWQRQRLGWGRESIQNAAANAAITGGFTSLGRSGRLLEDGWAFLDLCQDGFLTESLDTLGLSEAYLELSLSAASTITVLPIQVFPVRG